MADRALPPSGTITLNQVKGEFGKGNNLLDYLGEGGVTGSPPLKLTDFYGKAAGPTPIFDGAVQAPGYKETYEYNGYPDRVTGYNTSATWVGGHRAQSSQSSTVMLPGMFIGPGTYIIQYAARGRLRQEIQNAEFLGFDFNLCWRKGNFNSDLYSGFPPNVKAQYPPFNTTPFFKFPGWPSTANRTKVQYLVDSSWVECTEPNEGEYRQNYWYDGAGQFPVTFTDTYNQVGLMSYRPGINQWGTFDLSASDFKIFPSTRQADVELGRQIVMAAEVESKAARVEHEEKMRAMQSESDKSEEEL